MQLSATRYVKIEGTNVSAAVNTAAEAKHAIKEVRQKKRELVHIKRGLVRDKRVAAHCFAGIGRSPLMIATVLVRHGLDVDAAWSRVSAARGLMVPDTDAQWQWLADLAEGI